MKKWTRITAIVLLIVISCGLLTGCGKQSKIKKACEEKAEDVLMEASSKVFSQSLTSSAYELYKDKTTVDYNKDNNKFTCRVYAVISILSLNSNQPTFMYERFSFTGHLDKSEVVIDNTSASEISKSQLP